MRGYQHYTEEQLRSMSQLDLGRLYRFAEPGNQVFSDPHLYEVFKGCFKGWTPELSKQVGWS